MACCQDRESPGIKPGAVARITAVLDVIQSPITSLKYAYEPNDGKYGEVTFNSDGSLEYPNPGWTKHDLRELPPDINGFERDPEHLTLYHPKWQPCAMRLFGLRGPNRDGAIQVVALCNEPDAHFGKSVTHDDHCSTCPLRKHT